MSCGNGGDQKQAVDEAESVAVVKTILKAREEFRLSVSTKNVTDHHQYPKSEFENAKARYREKLLELGRRIPEDDREVGVAMTRCRKSPMELGYTFWPNGIWTGKVLVCGQFLPPPYRLSCELEEADDRHHRLVVNGVRLWTELPHDTCNQPYEELELPVEEMTGCYGRAASAIDRMEEEARDLAEGTTDEEFTAMAKRWKAMLEAIDCTASGETIKVEGPTIIPDFQVVRMAVFINSTGGKSSREIPFIAANLKDPRYRKRFKSPTREEMRQQTLDLCLDTKQKVERHLSEGLIVAYGSLAFPTYFSPQMEQEFYDTIQSGRHSQGLLSRYRQLARFRLASPECTLLMK